MSYHPALPICLWRGSGFPFFGGSNWNCGTSPIAQC